MLTDAEKTDVRRFTGYGAYGGGNPLPASGYRFSTQYGVLEYKINNLSDSELAILRTSFLANLSLLEADIPAMRCGLGTAEAAVWKRNPNEYRERLRLFDDVRRQFCGFLGIEPGPALGSRGLTIVVLK